MRTLAMEDVIDQIFTGVKALLAEAGVTEAQFGQLLIDNPRRALALATS
jgi:predicted metal-dependent phosphotriesterase family hydrolase